MVANVAQTRRVHRGDADLSLHLVEKFCGREIALQCAKSLLLSMPRHSQAGYAAVPLSPPHSDAQIREAESYLQAHYQGGASIDELARAVHMSPRNLIRRFKAATGRVPGEYLQALRVAAARELLEGGASVRAGDLHADRVRGPRVLPSHFQAAHGCRARRVSEPLCEHELRPARTLGCWSRVSGLP